MDIGHPSWCIGTEAGNADHVSETLHAAEPDDSLDIKLRLTHPEDVAADDTRLTLLELEVVECGEVFGFPLELRQARALADTLVRLLPAPSGREAGSAPASSASPAIRGPNATVVT